jgi:hypothetical protein
MSSDFRHRASLLSNIVLVGIVAALGFYRLTRASVPTVAVNGPGIITSEVHPRTVVKETPAAILQSQPQSSLHAEFKAPSDRRRWLIDELRAMGVPNDVLGRVARIDFEVQWDSRFDACHADMDKMAAVQLAMNLNKDAEMRAALGDKDFKQWDQNYMLWEAMSTKVDVTAAEADALYDLKKKLQQRQLEVEQARLKGTMDDAEINDAINSAYSEFNQKMRALLGDERFAKSQQIDDAFTADSLHYQLASVNPTDAQFQELSKVEKVWSQSQRELDPSAPDYLEKLKAVSDARDQAYQQVLGAEAFNNLQKQQDSTYLAMKKYENLWGLDDSKIDYVYTTMKQYQKTLENYQTQLSVLQAQGQSADWVTVNNKLQQSAVQTQQSLQNYLGTDSFNKLQRNRLLRWAGLGFQPATKNGATP